MIWLKKRVCSCSVGRNLQQVISRKSHLVALALMMVDQDDALMALGGAQVGPEAQNLGSMARAGSPAYIHIASQDQWGGANGPYLGGAALGQSGGFGPDWGPFQPGERGAKCQLNPVPPGFRAMPGGARSRSTSRRRIVLPRPLLV